MKQPIQKIQHLSYDPFAATAAILEHYFSIHNLMVRLHQEDKANHRFIIIAKDLAHKRTFGQTWIEIAEPTFRPVYINPRKKPLVHCGSVCNTKAVVTMSFTVCLHAKDIDSFISCFVPQSYMDEMLLIETLAEFASLVFSPEKNPEAFLHAWASEKINKHFPKISWQIDS